MAERASILPGTLELLILKAVSLGPEHGYGILLRIEKISGEALKLEQGALDPALYRLEQQGPLEADGVFRIMRAKFYRLTASGRRQLRDETEMVWNAFSTAVATALAAQPGQA